MKSLGKFIVIDGIDGSGKATQANLLKTRLEEIGFEVEMFDFPRYGEKSAGLVEEYLNGTYGTAEEVGPYAGSIFYAVDRYAASKKIKDALAAGKIVISNRYVSASKGHQTSKINDKERRKDFIKWLNELEYELFKIPVPDITFFLHVPADIGYDLVLKKKARKYIKGKKQDIHEADKEHLYKAENAYLEMIEGVDKKENWVKISCSKDDEILPIEVISVLIMASLKENNILDESFASKKRR
jgi:dTMP kinase